jgi:hypothetical protein
MAKPDEKSKGVVPNKRMRTSMQDVRVSRRTFIFLECGCDCILIMKELSVQNLKEFVHDNDIKPGIYRVTGIIFQPIIKHLLHAGKPLLHIAFFLLVIVGKSIKNGVS